MTGRVVCQFSCGAASAVATKLALAQAGSADVVIVNAYVAEEHPDNRRFLADCEKWFGQSVEVFRDVRFGASAINVFRAKRFMKSQHGAPCSRVLKRALLDRFHRSDDVLVFGFTVEESERFEDFQDRYPELNASAPLIDSGLTKSDCLAMIERAGIEMPLMYRLGYNNANCVGCVKGGEGYWNKIRRDFPERFAEVAQLQDEIGEGSFFFRNRLTGERFGLRDLSPSAGRHCEVLPSCSFFCEMTEKQYAA